MCREYFRHYKRYFLSPNLHCDVQGIIFLVSLDISGFYCWHYTMYKSNQSYKNVFYLITIHQQRIIRLNSVKLVTVYAGESEQSVSLQMA